MPAAETEVVFTRDGEEVLRRQLPPGSYTIGRWHEVDLHVQAELVSRQHAMLIVEEGRAFLEDLGSANGTFINGQQITEPTLLPPGTPAQLGTLTLEIPAPSHRPAISDALAEFLPDEFLRGKKYQVGPMIAQGGMGAIHYVREATVRRSVAMKLMLTEGEPEDLRRFIEEAQITGQLEHPNIVPVHELGIDDNGKIFYTMKLVKGITLLKILQLLADGVGETVKKYPLNELLTVFQKVCDAIAFAHSKGVIHRDLKPENVMIARYGEVLVMDWGIAKLVKPTGAPAMVGAHREVNVKSSTIQPPRADGKHFSTKSGEILGTPGFMSPEQARGEADSLRASSDVFALGAILYTILTLEFPFEGATAEAIVEANRNARPLPPAQRVIRAGKAGPAAGNGAPGKGGKGRSHLPGGRVPDALNAIAMKALAPRAEDRYQTVEEFQEDIAAYQGGFAASAERAGLRRQVWLLIQRNKVLAICAAIFFVLINAFGVNVLISRQNMAATLAQLRSTAPTFAAQARSLVEEGKLDEALDKIAFAIDLAPANADYHLYRANTLQAAQRLTDAAAEYRRVLTLRRGDEAAVKNLALCTELLADNGGAEPLKREIQTRLVEHLIAQRRRVEAAPLAALLGKAGESAEPAIRARIKEYAIQPGWSDTRLKRLPSGSYELDLNRLQIGDLGKFQGLPIGELRLDFAIIETLAGIEKLPLTALHLSYTRIDDISPLRGMKLRRLILDGTKVSDLTPLTDMPLENLSLNGVRATNLGPLRGIPLRIFNAVNTPITDITIIANPALENLTLNDTRVSDLSPLRGKKLRTLSLERCPAIFDLSPLTGIATLEEIHLPAQAIDCAMLRAMPSLRRIKMDGRTADLIPAATFWAEVFPTFAKAGPVRSALQGACNKILPPEAVAQTPEGELVVTITGLPVRDLAALHGQPLRELRANNSGVSDLTPLAGAPLRVVHLAGTGFIDCRMLAQFPELEEVIIPPTANHIDSLRGLSKLSRIGHEWNSATKHADKTAEEFWAARDAKKK